MHTILAFNIELHRLPVEITAGTFYSVFDFHIGSLNADPCVRGDENETFTHLQIEIGVSGFDDIAHFEALIHKLGGDFDRAQRDILADTVLQSDSEKSEFADIIVDFSLGIESPCLGSGIAFYEWGGRTLIDLQPNDYYGDLPDMGFLSLQQVNVYPGDTDNNGIVNEFDILPIGVYFWAEGNQRTPASMEWAPQSVLGWGTPAATYADVNGDGLIDQRDIIGIAINWDNDHPGTLNKYELSLADSSLLDKHLDSYFSIYNSLPSEGEAAIAIKTLLMSILNISQPQEFSLKQNYPNPFNPKTMISFTLPEPQNVTLKIFDMLGREIDNPISNTPFEYG